MKIHELFEQTIAPTPPGAPPAPTQVTTPVNTSTQTTSQAPTLGNQQPAQPMGQQPAPNPQQAQQVQQIQQSSKDTMTDLDKIAAQIVGLKQKQQELQHQVQTVA
jgi:peptidoglycan hydrolase CwlO-like protein